MPGAAVAPCCFLLRLLLRQHQAANAAASSTTPTGTATATASMVGDSPPEPRQGRTVHRCWWSVGCCLHANCLPSGSDKRAVCTSTHVQQIAALPPMRNKQLHVHPCATRKTTVTHPQCNNLKWNTDVRCFVGRQQQNPDIQYTLSKLNTVLLCSCNCCVAPSSSGCSVTHL